MQKLFPPFLVILVAGAIFASAQSAAQPNTAEELAAELSAAYSANELGSLTKQNVFYRSIRILIEHSIAEDGGKPLIEDATFRSFAAAEKWLTGRRPADYPIGRIAPPLVRCAKSTCTYDEPAMNHNSLFLAKFTYGIRRGRPYIKVIYFVDGD